MNKPNIRKAVHKIGQAFLLLLGFDCEARRKAVDDGICNFGGQGRDKYGR